MTIAGAAPASAQPAAPAAAGPTTNDMVCLTNADSYCLGVDPYVIAGLVLALPGAIKVVLDWINQGRNKQNQQQGEEKNEGTEDGGTDPEEGLCLAMTDAYNGDAYWTSCGANGTVWIAEPHSDGYYLESRWWYNQGVPNEVLTADPVANDSVLFAAPGEAPGGAYWQTFSWFAPITTLARLGTSPRGSQPVGRANVTS
jgi:hypothetical protein